MKLNKEYEFPVDAVGRYVRLTWKQSPSWVACDHLLIYGTPVEQS